MIELYHFGFSTCSQKVRLVLAEKGVEFASHEINLMAGEQHDPGYVKLNPKHVVPTLVHGGAHVRTDEERVVSEALGEFGCRVGCRSKGHQVHDLVVDQVRCLPAEGLDETQRF